MRHLDILLNMAPPGQKLKQLNSNHFLYFGSDAPKFDNTIISIPSFFLHLKKTHLTQQIQECFGICSKIESPFSLTAVVHCHNTLVLCCSVYHIFLSVCLKLNVF